MLFSMKVVTRPSSNHFANLIPTERKNVVFSFTLGDEWTGATLEELRVAFRPVKESLMKQIRSSWRDTYEYQEYKTLGPSTCYNLSFEFPVLKTPEVNVSLEQAINACEQMLASHEELGL